MHVYASPRRGFCASCDGRITDRPVYRMDGAYCCTGCAAGGPCVCSYEADLADDGVDGLGLPFLVDDRERLIPGADDEPVPAPRSAAASGLGRAAAAR
jgi:hypothetical protein